MPFPRISIVVPTRNQAAFIAQTLDSVLAQDYPGLELIVVDGASTDGTGDILRRYAPRLSLLISEPDRGQADAINKGMRRATGEVLTWLNSDDLLAGGALHQIALAHRQGGADVYAGIVTVFEDGGRDRFRHLPCVTDGPLPLAALLDLESHWLRGRFFYQPEVFFTRAIWRNAGARVNPALYYAMDYELWCRFAHAGARLRVLATDVARFREHAAQKTRTVEVYRPELAATAERLRRRFGVARPARPVDVRAQLRVVIVDGGDANLAHVADAMALAGHTLVLLEASSADAILAERPDLVLLGARAGRGLAAGVRAAGVPALVALAPTPERLRFRIAGAARGCDRIECARAIGVDGLPARLRARLGAQAQRYVDARHSLEALAGSLLAALFAAPALDLRLAPNILFGGGRARAPERRGDAGWSVLDGFGPREGPFPEQGLPLPFHWMTSRAGTLRVSCAGGGRVRVELDVRNLAANQHLRIRLDGALLHAQALDAAPMARQRVAFEATLPRGGCELELQADAAHVSTHDPRTLVLLVEDVRVGAALATA